MKLAAIHTPPHPPWFHRSPHGISVRIGPRRVLVLVRTEPPATSVHQPITSWDVGTIPAVYCRHCRVPWPCMGYFYTERATEARHASSRFISFMFANFGGAAGCNGARVYASQVSPPGWDEWLWTALVIAWIAMAAWSFGLHRLYRRIARTYEGLARD